jgi:hypothetical protein
MKKFGLILAFIAIVLPVISQESGNQYYMSFFAKYYQVSILNYEKEGYCVKVDLESSNTDATAELYVKYANLPNFIVNLEIIKSQFAKYTKQAVKDNARSMEVQLDSWFKRNFIIYKTRTHIYQDDGIKLKAFFEVKDDGQCIAVIESPSFKAPKSHNVAETNSFIIFQTVDEFEDFVNVLKKFEK